MNHKIFSRIRLDNPVKQSLEMKNIDNDGLLTFYINLNLAQVDLVTSYIYLFRVKERVKLLLTCRILTTFDSNLIDDHNSLADEQKPPGTIS